MKKNIKEALQPITYNAKPSAATAVETLNCSITNGIAGAYADDPM